MATPFAHPEQDLPPNRGSVEIKSVDPATIALDEGLVTILNMTTKRWYGKEVAGLLLAGLSVDEIGTAARRFNSVDKYLTAGSLALAGLRRVEPTELPNQVWAFRRGEDGYPAAVEALANPPLVLVGRGRLENLREPCIAVLSERDGSSLARAGARAVAAYAPAAAIIGIDLSSPAAASIAAERPALVVVPDVEALASIAVDALTAAGGTAVAPLGSRISAPMLLAGFAALVIAVEARRGGPATAAAVHAATAGKTVVALRPRQAAWTLPGAQGLVELTRPEGARAEMLGLKVSEETLNQRVPFADAVIERLDDLLDILAVAWAFRPEKQE